ncbi:hypothetical protein LY10_01943 [Planktotalea frisia]|jgi:hypothetical protein|uniref:Excalibur calcium-binding domain protein n=1 Tax=Planktotalea frisia TaxID=696762 RepID=A0A1L9NXQ7_9RHOB|nr:hypothetical protein [Planktotalea frisia]OJI94039.1 hypothetical protein PFRI_17780 [Planktotalea frisia]PZX28950.1 hypothetical protein LY10_01943 [Planktotalea frisia]
MKRFFLPTLALGALVALSACSPTIPDSGAGVGFGDYNEFERAQAARDAALTGGGALPPPQAVSSESLAPAAASGIAQATSGQATVNASPTNAAPVLRAGGISAENDFNAVSGQRSIEGDAAKRAQNQQQYQVIQPTALPTRQGNAGPNIVAFALAAKNAKGQRVYRRNGFNAERKYQRACSGFASQDQAQQEFLAAGGPVKDRSGMDPDGDGFACAWDPAPFRNAVSG